MNHVNQAAALPMPPAHIDERYRRNTGDEPDEVLTGGTDAPEEIADAFAGRYKGRWVTWPTRIEKVRLRDPAKDYEGACGVVGASGRRAKLLLQQFPDGCVLKRGRSIWFTGRLAALKPDNFIEIELPEPADGTCPPAAGVTDAELRTGLELYQQAKFEEAIPHLRKAVAAPDLPRTEKACGFLWLAHSHDKVAQLQTRAAMDAMCEAVKLAPYIAAPEGSSDLYAKARERCLPSARAGRLQAAVAVARGAASA
jgi:hypothetical protein